jgi:hypothetical protein
MSTVNQIVNGAFQDPEGNPLANGFLLFELSQDGVVNTSTRVCAGHTIRVPLNSSGDVPSSPIYSLWPNTVITPSTTFYTLSAYSSTGQLVWGPNPVSITASPSPLDLGTLIPGDIN